MHLSRLRENREKIRINENIKLYFYFVVLFYYSVKQLSSYTTLNRRQVKNNFDVKTELLMEYMLFVCLES